VSSTTAEVVLDPFSGSGTTAIAALNHGRQYIGIELSKDYAATSRSRIDAHQALLSITS
jgi:modification methylase